MKQFVFFMFAIFICIVAYAQTETINWYMDDGTTYTTTCEAGGDIILPQTPTKRGYTFVGWAGYTPIEYLESTGTQWIDTQIIGKSGIKVKMKLFLTANTGSALGCISNKTRFQPVFIYGGKWDSIVGTDKKTGTVQLHTIYIVDFVSDLNGYKFYVDGELIIEGEDVLYSGDTNMFMFARNQSSTYNMSGRIYYLKIYDNDVLVRDFIPVLDSVGIPCMFDKVEGKFYYNAGTGDFIAGPVIDGE